MTRALAIIAAPTAATVAGLLCLAVAAYGSQGNNSASVVNGVPSLVIPLGHRPASYTEPDSSASDSGIVRVQPTGAVPLTSVTTPVGADRTASSDPSPAANAGQSEPTSTQTPSATPKKGGDTPKGNGSGSGDGKSKKNGGTG